MLHNVTREFIRAIPKTDLHVHLDGSLRLATLIELAPSCGVTLPSSDEAGMRELVFKEKYKSLGEYLQGFAYTCGVLQSAENLERAAYELAEDCLAEGVRYVEVRFAPQLHVRDGLSLERVVRAVSDGMSRAKAEHDASAVVQSGHDIPFEYGLILCAMRSFNEDMGPYFAQMLRSLAYTPRKRVFATASLELARAAAHLARDVGLPVVAFDLAGEEAGYPAIDHREAYQYAHKNFLKKTVHAGEAYGPESIFQAITECHTNRIGHGTFLFAADMVRDSDIEDPVAYTRLLAETIASQRITIEVCPTSNLQTTPEIRSMAEHPVLKMIDYGMSVTICTDNRLVSNTTVSRELELVADKLQITRSQFRNLVVAGFKGSFYPGSYRSKRAYVRRVIDRYEQLERDLLGE